MRSSGGLALSVVVAAWNDPLQLRTCLRSLDRARERRDFELIVAHPAARGFEEAVGAAGLKAVYVAVTASPTVPGLRKAGLDRATGDVVAFLEDHATVCPEWSDALMAEYEVAGRVAVGGPVAQADGSSSLAWGAYLFDYGRFMPPQPRGPVRELSGLNMSFTRPLLEASASVLGEGVFEGPLFELLHRRRNELHLAPMAIVYHNKRYSLPGALVDVFHLGRGYAGRRLRGKGVAVRVVRAAGCALLPALLVWRTLSIVYSRSQSGRPPLRSLTYLSLLATLWSVGEFAGCLVGPGVSESRWR